MGAKYSTRKREYREYAYIASPHTSRNKKYNVVHRMLVEKE